MAAEGRKGGFKSAEEAWWAVLHDLGPGKDETMVVDALAALRAAVVPPLPSMVRPTIVRDVCSFLVAPSEKPLIERVKFLTLQEVKLNELSQALRLLPVLAVLPAEDVIKASRHYRIDMVEAAMSFFESEVVRKETLEDKITFLMRNKELSNVEIDEALDRLSIPRLVRPVNAVDETSTASPSGDMKKRKALMDQARAFLRSDAVAKASEQEVIDFLLKIGLSQDDIREVRNEAPQSRDQLMDRAKTFLSSPAVKSVSEEEVNQFLLKEGLTFEDIALARKAVAATTTTPTTRDTSRESAVNPQPILSPEKEQKIQKAVQFLKSVPRQDGKAEEFLRSKGYTPDEIDMAMKLAGADDPPPPLENAINFLGTSQAQSASDEAVDAFLLKKGFSKAQIDEARVKANRPRRASPPSSMTASSKSNVDRAIEFLRSPSVQGTPMADRIAFLKARGVSDAEIQTAMEAVGISPSSPMQMNQTNGTSTTTTRRAPGLPTMCISTVDRLMSMDASGPMSDELVFARAEFISEMVLNCFSILRLPARFSKQWSSLLMDKCLNGVEARIFAQREVYVDSEPFQVKFESLVAELCELVGGSSSEETSRVVMEWVNRVFARLFATTTEQIKMGLGLMLSRCFHGHFSSRASENKYELLEPLYLFKESRTNSSISVETFLLAAMLRGAVDFGCGLGAPRVPMDEKNERNVTPEKDMRELINSKTAKANRFDQSIACGTACVYAGLTWLDSEKSWQAIADSILEGSLGFPLTRPEETLDSASARAVKFVQLSAFKLAATSAQLLCSQCAESQTVRDEMLRQLNESCDQVYRSARAHDAIRSVLAKRLVERTYDEHKSQMTLEDALGQAQGQLGRIFQTRFLVAIVILEPCLTPERNLEDIAWTWECVASLAFAMVPVPEVLKLNQWMDLVMRLDDKKSFPLLCKACRIPSSSSSKSLGDDWVLAAKIEYLMDTAKRIIKPGWDEASLVAVEQEKDEDETEDDDETESKSSGKFQGNRIETELLVHALEFGASFPFPALNRRCHSMVTESLAASCIAVTASTSSSSSRSPPLIVMAMVPSYIEKSLSSFPQATDASSMAFVLGSVLTSFSKNAHVLAQPLAVVAYSKIVSTAHELLTKKQERKVDDDDGDSITKGTFSREQKTKADLVLNLAFASLKACSLPALAMCLERLELLFKFVVYREMHGRIAAVPSHRMRKALFGVISRIDDSNRRAILALWFLKRVQDDAVISAAAEEEVEQTTAEKDERLAPSDAKL